MNLMLYDVFIKFINSKNRFIYRGDITMENELEHSKYKYRCLFEESPMSIFLMGMDGLLIDCNAAAEEIFGYPKEELLGKDFREFSFFPPKHKQTVIKAFKTLLKVEIPERFEVQTYKKDGGLAWVQIQTSIVKSFKKKLILICFQDITEKRKMREDLRKTQEMLKTEEELENYQKNLEKLVEERTKELKEFEEKYLSLIENLPTGIVVHDADTSVILCNKKAEELLGLSYEQMIGKKVIDKDWNFLREDGTTLPLEEYPVNLITSTKKPLKNFIAGIITSESKDVNWVLVNGFPNLDENGIIKNIITTNTDITDRKKMEFELQKTLDKMRYLNKELERFAYVASHDLQEPLRMISSFSQLLEKRYKDKLDEDADEFIEYIVDGAKRMQKLINDLLIYSRVGRGDEPFIPIDTNVVLKNVIKNLKQSIDDTNAEITHDILPTVIANESEMIQLFQNLISNAIKFHREDPPYIHVSAKLENDEWIFSVKDNGIGIDSKYFDRIFIIFQRLHKKDEYGGTGIGLAVCKKIIQRHGGKIWVESEKGKGSTFYFSISIKRIISNLNKNK
jgi:PAS domain S-box-containing protein